MGINLKAAFLSGLVLPGLGQLYKGCRVKGVIMIGLVNLFLIAALLITLQGVGKIMLSAKIPGSPEMGQVLEMLRNDTPAAKWLLTGFLCLWIYGVVDALVVKKH